MSHHVYPVLPAMMEETYRIAIILWVIPWAKSTVDEWIEMGGFAMALLRAVFDALFTAILDALLGGW